MIRHYGIYTALLAVLLQVFTPAIAALTPAKPMHMDMAMTSMHEHCEQGGEAAATTTSMAASPHSNHGCCCHGLWNCGTPCGAVALTSATLALPLLTPSAIWNTATVPFIVIAPVSFLLRPPIAA